MVRILAIALATCILASGCSVIRVEERPMAGPEGSIELMALRRDDPGELTSGYEFRVKGQGHDSGWIAADPACPILLPDLPPGTYRIEVQGRGISKKRFEVEIRAGVRTAIAVLRKNVKRNDRLEKAAEDVGNALAQAGQVVLVGLGYVAYGILWLCVEGCLGDDDDDDEETCPPDPAPSRTREPRGYREASRAGSGYSGARRP